MSDYAGCKDHLLAVPIQGLNRGLPWVINHWFWLQPIYDSTDTDACLNVNSALQVKNRVRRMGRLKEGLN